jgi:hypothetical protein
LPALCGSILSTTRPRERPLSAAAASKLGTSDRPFPVGQAGVESPRQLEAGAASSLRRGLSGRPSESVRHYLPQFAAHRFLLYGLIILGLRGCYRLRDYGDAISIAEFRYEWGFDIGVVPEFPKSATEGPLPALWGHRRICSETYAKGAPQGLCAKQR